MVYTCDACKYSTDRKNNFTKHEKTKKHLHKVELYNQRRERVAKYNFVCELCQKRFPQSRDLERHLNRQTPCTATSQVQNIGTQNINIDTYNNITNNNNNYYINIDFSDLKKLCACKDEKFLLTHIENNVEDIMKSQGRFNKYADEFANIQKDKIIKENEFEEEFAEKEKARGVDYIPELTDINSYNIDLTDVIIKTFFDNDFNHMSLFRKPHIQNTGEWLVKLACKAFDPQVSFVLVENCPEKDHFTSTCFQQLDFIRLADAYKVSVSKFLHLLDNKRNGFNVRTL